jgi:hypothetical protein
MFAYWHVEVSAQLPEPLWHIYIYSSDVLNCGAVKKCSLKSSVYTLHELDPIANIFMQDILLYFLSKWQG